MTTITDPLAFKSLKITFLSRLREQRKALSGRNGPQNQQPLTDVENLYRQAENVVDVLAGRDEIVELYRSMGRQTLKRAHQRLLDEQRHTLEGEQLGLNARRPRKLLGVRQDRVDSMGKLIEWCERHIG